MLSVGQKELSIHNLRKLLKLDPNHIEANLLMGKVYLLQGLDEESSQCFWKVHAFEPNNLEIKQYVDIMKKKMQECISRANQEIIGNNFEMALLYTKKGAKFYPNHPELLVLRSGIYKRLGQYDECLVDLNKALENMKIDSIFI